MRTLKDRIRHTVLFETIALAMVATVGSWATGHSVEQLGLLGLMFSAIAMVWNMVFNWMFDHWDLKYRSGAKRTVRVRIAHALLFEGAFLTIGAFLIAWWLSISLLDALVLDVSFSVFFLVYAFVFNWMYDMVFPIARPVLETS